MKWLVILSLFFIIFSPQVILAQTNEIVLPVPLIAQERNLSCESAAIRMILASLNIHVSEQEILNKFQKHPNPDIGFRGNVDGRFLSFEDYGVHADPVAAVLTSFGVNAKPYRNISQDFLKEKVLQGKTAIIWIAPAKTQVKHFNIVGFSPKLVLGEHTLVVRGYKNGAFLLNDPYGKKGAGVPKGAQLTVKNLDSLNWHLFDRMAVIVD